VLAYRNKRGRGREFIDLHGTRREEVLAAVFVEQQQVEEVV
jgi:hypothetical protein